MVTKLPSRHFYRCADCLAVVATEEKIPVMITSNCGYNANLKAVCDACGGRMEYMGETIRRSVSQQSLQKLVGYKCACDGKCTNALGPSCDCVCSGENHGTGRVVAV